MSVRRVAMLSVHTSPLAQPGSGDGGGMNVYVRSLAGALARAGVECDLLTRCEDPGRARRRRRRAGCACRPPRAPVRRSPIDKRDLSRLVDPLVDAARALHLVEHAGFDVLHANYWISGDGRSPAEAPARPPPGHDVPHARARARPTVGHRRRPVERVARRATRSSRAPTADSRPPPTSATELVAALRRRPRPRSRSCRPVSTTACSRPATARGARRAPAACRRRPVLLFVGRIQPLKGADLALRCLAELPDAGATLVVVGGPSGADGAGRARPAPRARVRRSASPSASGGSRRNRTSARRLLPRRRRVPRAVAHRVVRAGRARSRRVRHAGGRGERRWAALARRPTARPGSSSTAAIPPTSRRRSPTLLADPELAAEIGAERGDALGAVHVEHHRGAAAPRSTPTSAPASSSSAPELAPATGDDRRTPTALEPGRGRRTRCSPRTSRPGRARAVRRRPSSTTPSCAAGTCASAATAATRRRSTSTCTSARCATRCTSSPTRPRTPRAVPVPAPAQPRMYGARFSIGPDGDLYLIGPRRARAPRRARSSTASSACSTSSSRRGSSRCVRLAFRRSCRDVAGRL